METNKNNKNFLNNYFVTEMNLKIHSASGSYVVGS